MEKSFRQLLKNYFSFSRSDRNAVIMVSILLTLTILGHLAVSLFEVKPENDFFEIEQAFNQLKKEKPDDPGFKNLFRFNPNTISETELDSLDIPAFVKRNMLNYRKAGGVFKRPEDIRRIYGMNDSIFSEIEPFIRVPAEKVETADSESGTSIELPMGTFDPNTASEKELPQFGFNRFQISNLIKYRKSGGSFMQPDDLLKIYGIDSTFLNTVRSNIEIKLQNREVPNVLAGEPVKKISLELNSADSLQLIELQGIGPVFASRIIKYRELLGGFYSGQQLLEVYGISEETYYNIRGDILVDTSTVKKLRINFAEYSELLRHPYFKKDHVDAILKYRREKGPFNSNVQVFREGLVDSVSFVALKPYLTCR
jgi:DNA uptake protein ComE-like DNA-binding protein